MLYGAILACQQLRFLTTAHSSLQRLLALLTRSGGFRVGKVALPLDPSVLTPWEPARIPDFFPYS